MVNPVRKCLQLALHVTAQRLSYHLTQPDSSCTLAAAPGLLWLQATAALSFVPEHETPRVASPLPSAHHNRGHGAHCTSALVSASRCDMHAHMPSAPPTASTASSAATPPRVPAALPPSGAGGSAPPAELGPSLASTVAVSLSPPAAVVPEGVAAAVPLPPPTAVAPAGVGAALGGIAAPLGAPAAPAAPAMSSTCRCQGLAWGKPLRVQLGVESFGTGCAESLPAC